MSFHRFPYLLMVVVFMPSLMIGSEALPYGERIADAIIPSEISVEFEEFIQMPATSDKAPLTRINQMVSLADGSGLVYLTDLRGKLYEISSGKPILYMDYLSLVPELMYQEGLGSGLVSVAFHPEFRDNGRFYTVHTEEYDESANSLLNLKVDERRRKWASTGVITEWTDLNRGDAIFKGERREIMRLALPTAVHAFQKISFNPLSQKGDEDYGNLYIGLGESGAVSVKRSDLLRNPKSPLGCILRIDPLGSGSLLGDYGFPDDNPWANDSDEETLGEIYCMGIRNPHRISWDRGGSGRMFFGDIGEMRIEEVNICEKGRDYGWPIREGYFRHDPNGMRFDVFNLTEEERAKEGDLTYPVVQYDHREGFAISGGRVYRGEDLPHLYGKYIFGDIVTGRMFYVEESLLEFGKVAPVHEFFMTIDGKSSSLARMNGGARADLRLGWSAEGELYIFEKGNGRVFRALSSDDSSGEVEVSGLDLQRIEHSRKVDPEMAVVASGEAPLIDDFEGEGFSCVPQEGREGVWQPYGLTEENGAVSLEIVDMEGAPGEGTSVLRLRGKGPTTGGDLVVLSLLGKRGLDGMHYDASEYDGIQYWVKSKSGQRLSLFVNTVYTVPESRGGLCDGKVNDCDLRYRAKTGRSEDWTLVQIEFSRFEQFTFPNDGPLDAQLLKEIGFLCRSRSDYEFWVDDVSFYKIEQ